MSGGALNRSGWSSGEAEAKTTALLADNHPRVLESVQRLLMPRFCVVGAVPDGSALIAAALEFKPHVIVTDLMMEPTSGLEAAEAILAHSAHPPAIVVLTGIADYEIAQRAFAIGVLGYVLKTRLAEDLIPAIETALRRSRFLSPLPTSGD